MQTTCDLENEPIIAIAPIRCGKIPGYAMSSMWVSKK